jgi:DNA-binding MarR family transcriptional regulator
VEGDGVDYEDEWGAFGTWPEDPRAPIPDHIFELAPLVFALLDAARTVSLAIDWIGPGAPMTAPQARVAARLARAPDGIPVVNVAEHFGISSAAASKILRRMSDLGTLEYGEHPRDGRCKLVLLTDKGRTLLAGSAKGLARQDRALRIALGPDLAKEALPALREVARYFLYPRILTDLDLRRPVYS